MADGLETKHTPGPWRLEQGTTLIWGHCNDDDSTSCGMGYPVAEARVQLGFGGSFRRPFDHDTAEANARLIAAAPEMFEALKSIFDECEAVNIPSLGAMEKARAAIAKATGEER